MTEQRDITVRVPVLARVEGEGALSLRVRAGRIEELRLAIYEPPRLFEKFLEGRDFEEVPDIVARICGICPAAYQMSAVHALERLFSCDPGPWVRRMRRLLYCGEWIESHSLHIHLLAAPDFLGYASVPEMAREFPDEVRRGLRLQALGNEIMALLGGRSVHPVGVCVGGFYSAPSTRSASALCEKLRAALPDAEALVAWTAGLNLPVQEQLFTSMAMRHADEYPMNEGWLATSDGLTFDAEDFEQHVVERQVEYSTALHAHLAGNPYLVGPLARLNLNLDRLPSHIREALERTGCRFPSKNMFHSIVARAIEIYYALDEAVRILEAYEPSGSPRVPVQARAGIGRACTEAPRGVLWHNYRIAADGRIEAAHIVPPTSQNQSRIEQDLRLSLENYGLEHDDDSIRLRAEQVIRNYDPCISCATHFLRIDVERA